MIHLATMLAQTAGDSPSWEWLVVLLVGVCGALCSALAMLGAWSINSQLSTLREALASEAKRIDALEGRERNRDLDIERRLSSMEGKIDRLSTQLREGRPS